MQPGRPSVFVVLAVTAVLSSFAIALAPTASAVDDGEQRDVHLSAVQGDVRLSRGHGQHPDLDRTWEQAARRPVHRAGVCFGERRGPRGNRF